MKSQASVKKPKAEGKSASADGGRPCKTDPGVEELNDPKLLRGVAKKHAIENTKSLVATYNATTDIDERGVLLHWLLQYDRRRDDCLEPKRVLEYAELAKIAPRCTQDKEVLKNLVSALGSCLRQRKLPPKNLAVALCRALEHVDAFAYSGVADLMVIAKKLLASLSPEPKISRENFADHGDTFKALQQVLFLLDGSSHDNIGEEERQELRRAIVKKQKAMGVSCHYYPVGFYFKTFRQAMERLDSRDNSSTLAQTLPCTSFGLCAILHFFVRCIRDLASFEVDQVAIVDSNRKLSGMAGGAVTSKRPWFNLFRDLAAARIDASKDVVSLELFDTRYTAALGFQRTMRKGEDLKALRFGIIQELGALATEGSIEKTREEATKKLLDLATQEAVDEGWIGEADILLALLDVTYEIYKTNQNDERTKDALQLLHQPCRGSAKKALSQWLGGRSLEDKLRVGSPQRPVAEPNELFVEIGREVGYVPRAVVDSNREQLRKRYMHDDFATVIPRNARLDKRHVLQVASLFGEGSRKHVKDMKHYVIISEEVPEECTDAVTCGIEERNARSSNRGRDQAKENDEQKRRVAKPIVPEGLFKRRSLKYRAPESEIRRVLLYGNHGTGKTCITKLIAHRWALGEMAHEFDVVYVVPVRALNSTEHKGQQWERLEVAISQICFPKRNDTFDFEDLVAQIQDELDSPSTLLMVDGLDEANDDSRELVSNIWGRSCKVLLLSRPYNMENVDTRVDLHVECLGFNDRHLQDYIESELSEDDAPRLIRLLEHSDVVWEMAHTPVAACILCSLWKERGGAVEDEGRRTSTFHAYSDMANHVWKKFEERQRERTVKKSELFGYLEKIAFEALQSGAILVHERSVMKHATSVRVAQTFKERGLPLLTLNGQEYQFPHLTFQEYFAGRYVARSLKQKGSDEERRALDFIREGKYNEKHALTLSFAMHAFARGRSKNALKEMLAIVDQQPVEVLGIRHFFLRMQVLEAVMEEAEDAELEALANDERAIELTEGARRLLEGTLDNEFICEIVVEKLDQCVHVLEKFPVILDDAIDETKTILASSRRLTWKEKVKVDVLLKLARHSSK